MLGLQRMRAFGKPLANIIPKRSAGNSAGSEAYPFGIKPGTSSNEGWENMVYGFYSASLFVMVVGLANKPGTDIRQWAKEEAMVRNKMKDQGEEVEWGTYYNRDGKGDKYQFVKSDIGAPPTADE